MQQSKTFRAWEGGEEVHELGDQYNSITHLYIVVEFTSCTFVAFWIMYGMSGRSFLIFDGHMSLLGATDTLFWTSGDVPSGFQSQSVQPYSHLVEAYVMYVP